MGGGGECDEGCPLPVTPANSTDSCDNEPADIPHAIDTIRMTVSSLLPTVPWVGLISSKTAYFV